MTPTKRTRPVDQRIGHNLRVARLARGLSQSDLGDALGVSFQQIQKYENGTNRISGSAMIALAQKLNLDPLRLMDGAWPVGPTSPAPHQLTCIEALAAMPWGEPLAAAFIRMPLPARRALLQLAQAVAERETTPCE